jgi:UDP-hydrolysing UDP-N-acetyl-D-glucosamine 2-epimerase
MVSENPSLNFDPIAKYGGVGMEFNWQEGYIVVLQHPVTTEYKQAKKHVLETLHAIKDLDYPTFWFWPNVDAGSDGTSNGIRSFRELEKPGNIHFFKNMNPIDFLKLVKNAKALIGNSSAGLRECAYLGVPVVNIGNRQHRRSRAQNVTDVDYNREQILKAPENALVREHYPSSKLYGDGNAGEKITEILATVELTYSKTITY